MTFIRHIRKIGVLLSFFIFLFLINPFKLNIYFGYVIVVLILIKKRFILKNLDSIFFLLLVTSIVYALFYTLDPKSGSQFIIVYALFPSSFYLLGKYIFGKLSGNKDYLFFFLFILGTLYSFTPLISVLLNIKQGGFGQLDRSLPLFWNGQLVTATIMGSYYTLNMCLPSLIVIKQKKFNWLFKASAISIFLLSLASAIRIGSRTQILVFIIVLLFTLTYIIPRQSRQRNVITFLVFLTGIAIILSKVSFDLDQDWLSTFAGRMEKGGSNDIASGGGRLVRWEKSIENIFVKPLGWETEEFGHSHNLWLDVLRVAGVIPFFLLLGFTIKSFLILKSAVSKNKENLTLNIQLFTYFIAFNLVFMVEPIFEGVIEMFAIFCLFMGVVVMYNNKQR